LTAYETFKPLILNSFRPENGYRGSNVEHCIIDIENVLNGKSSAPAKSKLTNEYLTTFALIEDATKLANQFSIQRKYLNRRFLSRTSQDAKESFIVSMRNLALYWSEIIGYDPSDRVSVPRVNLLPTKEQKIVSTCLLYLNDSGHKMASTVLSVFYSKILSGEEGAAQNFADAVKTVAAFYTIWRAADSNKGLDDVYRDIMKGCAAEGLPGFSSANPTEGVTVENLKKYLKKALQAKGFDTIANWKQKSLINSKFNSAKYICRFMLYLASDDTVTDADFPGLMKIGSQGSYEYLTPQIWKSKHLRTIEHIAPVSSGGDGSEWDSNLYVDEEYHLVGNLTLLPMEINSSLGNNEWKTKVVYYKHLAVTDPDELDALKAQAEASSVILDQETLRLLKESSHAHHIRSIVNIDGIRPWDKDVVVSRTERICDIVWSKISDWVFKD